MSNWRSIKISDFLSERKGRYNYDDSSLNGLQRIEKIDFDGEIYIGDKPSKTKMIKVREGDLVISGINVSKGAMGIYLGNDDVKATIHYSSYVFDKKQINIDYFKWFLKSDSFLDLLKKQVKGGIKTEIKPKHLLPLEIVLPDLKTQYEIAQLISRQQKIVKNLALENLKQSKFISHLRRQVIQDAIEGKLTKKWRLTNRKLASINSNQEKRELGTKIKIPKEWEWKKLEDIQSSIRYGTSKKCVKEYEEGLTTILRIPNVSKGFLDLTDLKYTSLSQRELNNLDLAKGDILIIRSNGSKDIVGSSVLINKNMPNHSYAGYLIRLRLNNVNPEYINFAFKSSHIRNSIETPLRTTVGIKNINSTELKNLLFPIPPMKEQGEIVEKIKTLMNYLKELEERVEKRGKNIEMLKKSILRESFEN